MENDSLSRTGTTLHVLLRDPASPAAWSAFVGRYGPKIYDWCGRWKLQEADAQDVTQTVLTKLVQQMQTFVYDPKKGTFRGWLKTVTYNAWMDILKKRQRPGGAASGDSDVQELIQTVQARDDLVLALEEEYRRELFEEAKTRVQVQASPRDWKIFIALALEGRPAKDVAAEHQMTVAAVYMAKSRLQEKLADEVKRLEGDP